MGKRGHLPVWGRQQIIDAVLEHQAEHGGPPTASDWRYSGGSLQQPARHPNADTVRGVFGTFDAAIRATELEPAPRWRTWSDQDIIACLQADAARLGRSPRPGEWRQVSYSLGAAHPNTDTVIKHFGSWANALEAAGLEPCQRSKESVIEALRAYDADHGQALSSYAWKELPTVRDRTLPSANWVVRAFGSWKEALDAAGLEKPPRAKHVPTARRFWTKEKVVAALRAWADAYGRAPRPTDWRYAGDDSSPGGRHPSEIGVTKLFGSWRTAIAVAGLELTYGRLTSPALIKNKVIADLQAWANAYGRAPRPADWRHASKGPVSRTPHPSFSTVYRLFGSWHAALAAAGLGPDYGESLAA